jgi:hypothetical protein
MSLLSRDEFAQAVLIQLAARGGTTAEYDAENFTIWHKPAGHSKLHVWYEKYEVAAREGRGDEAIAVLVDLWFQSKEEMESGIEVNKSRLIPLVRSRFDYEINALRSAQKQGDNYRDWMNLFAHQPLAEHLDIVVAEDRPEHYSQISRLTLKELGMSWDEALRLAMWNFPKIDAGARDGNPFQEFVPGYWMYAAPTNELFTTMLLYPESIRRLPVKGKHVAFVPKVSSLAITGADNDLALYVLISMTRDALRESGRTVSAVPFVLEASGWKPWLPPASHAMYWAVKELHIAELDHHYEAQKQVLDELLARDHGDDAPFVASYAVAEFGEYCGEPVLTSQCVWTQYLDSLLPKTEVVILTQFLNWAALQKNEHLEPKFGERITITWKQLADYLGPRLQKLDYYPERYQVRGEDFPVGDDWKRLTAAQATLPLEGTPGAKPAPLPKLIAPIPAQAVEPARAPAPVSPTQLAKPFSPPQDLKPPPEPSLWPLALLGLFGLTCLGGGIGVLVLGIQWIHGSLQNVGAGSAVAAAPEIQPQQQPNPFPQPVPARPLPPPDELPQAQPPDPNKFEDAIRNAIQRVEEQMARDDRHNLPDVSPLEPAPELTEPMPLRDTLPPLPPPGKPEQALPALAFGPSDVEPLGREIDGEHLFQDIAPPGGWLVGLRATKGRPWNGAIVALQPIYQVAGEYQLGQQCGSGQQALEHAEFLAKPGYAIGKIEARLGLIMNALRIHFYRVDGTSLVPADSYTTDWFGAEGGGPHVFDGGGSPLVGLAGSFVPEGEVITIQVLRKKP